MVDETVEESGELNPNDPQAREIRERAVEYADKVAAGEEPWKDIDPNAEPADSGYDDVDEPSDDDVEEPAPEVPDEALPARDEFGNRPK
jgi:hypothetical protein